MPAHFLPAGSSRPLTFTEDKANRGNLLRLRVNRSISETEDASNTPRRPQTIFYLFALRLQELTSSLCLSEAKNFRFSLLKTDSGISAALKDTETHETC